MSSHAQDSSQAQTIVVIADAPLPSAIDLDKLPGEARTLSVPVLTQNRESDVLPNAVASRLSSVSLNDEQGSQFQPDFVYRGFEASPISGVPEGIAVYQDGIRLNESFGDDVNWDLVPEFAVQTFSLQSNNPVFGLNAIGGAVSLQMKSGLDFQGANVQLGGGSFGNFTGDGEYGARFGPFAFYLGVGGVHDDGFRYRSPTSLRQLYSDLGYEEGQLTLHLSASGALNDIAAVGPTPVEMLAQDRKAIFTYPQSMHNEMELVQLRGTYSANDVTSISFNAYDRHYKQHLIDGNTTDVDYCDNDDDQLCLEGGNIYPQDALNDPAGNQVPASVLPPDATPGETDFTHTDTNTFGFAAQLTYNQALAGHRNHFVLGASVDRGSTSYSAYGELGTLLDTLAVTGSGVIIDQSQSPTASPPIETPVRVDADTTYTGAYAINVLDLTNRLSWSASARFNLADISLQDRLGTALYGDHSFTRINPGTGITYKLADGLVIYAGYSQTNRAPTAGELSCADPASPCLLDAFLVSDPPLKQVVSRNYEAGLRGTVARVAGGSLKWSLGVYRSEVFRDILLLPTDVNGFGYFQNGGTTRHQGADVYLDFSSAAFTVSTSYSYLEATFRTPEALSSNSPDADDNDSIYVEPGDHMPMTPSHRLTISTDYDVLPVWKIGADLRWQSGQYLIGDESNKEPKLPGFATVSVRTSFDVSRSCTIFAEIENLFDHHYYTYGAFTELDGLPPSLSLSNPRTLSPAPGRLFFAGLRLRT